MSTATFSALGQMGRLGNQLFQMAGTIGYALDTGRDFCFPRWSYQDYMHVDIGEVKDLTPAAEEWLRYTELNKDIEGNVDVYGHLLSTKYFDKHRDFILNYFKLKPKWNEYIESKYGHLFNKNTCSIHVRRGDYLEPEQQECQGLLPLKYYHEAIKLIGRDKTFVVFSDDIEWCKENSKGHNFIFIEGEPDIIDLFIMSKCQDNIIANSSFSWWAAYLNQNKGRRVVAPKQWFKYTEGWDDLYQNDWIRI